MGLARTKLHQIKSLRLSPFRSPFTKGARRFPKTLADDLLKAAATLPRLERLYLFASDPSVKGLAALRKAPALNALGLFHCNLMDESLAHLPDVTELYLRFNLITDEGAAQLVQLRNLCELDLSHTRVTRNCLKSLQSHPELCTIRLCPVEDSNHTVRIPRTVPREGRPDEAPDTIEVLLPPLTTEPLPKPSNE